MDHDRFGSISLYLSYPATRYAHNDRGQAFGSAMDAPSPDEGSDLIQAIATSAERRRPRR